MCSARDGHSSPSLEVGLADSLCAVLWGAALEMSVNPRLAEDRGTGDLRAVTSLRTVVVVTSWDHLSGTTGTQL